MFREEWNNTFLVPILSSRGSAAKRHANCNQPNAPQAEIPSVQPGPA